MNIITAGTRKLVIPNFGPVVPARPIGGAAAFVGAYDDVPNIIAAFGMRRLLTSYESNLLRIRRSSDSTEQDFGYVANGDLDAAAIATFVGAGSGFVTTWYDQSGNAKNITQSTAANQPLYMASGINSKPNLDFDGIDNNMVIPQLWADFGDSTFLFVLESDDGSNEQRFIVYNEDNGFVFMRLSPGGGFEFLTISSGNKSVTSATVGTNPTVSVFRVDEGVDINGWINGSAMTGNGTAIGGLQETAAPGRILGANRAASATWFNGRMAEIVIADAALATADREAAQTAANDYWSIFA